MGLVEYQFLVKHAKNTESGSTLDIFTPTSILVLGKLI